MASQVVSIYALVNCDYQTRPHNLGFIVDHEADVVAGNWALRWQRLGDRWSHDSASVPLVAQTSLDELRQPEGIELLERALATRPFNRTWFTGDDVDVSAVTNQLVKKVLYAAARDPENWHYEHSQRFIAEVQATRNRFDKRERRVVALAAR